MGIISRLVILLAGACLLCLSPLPARAADAPFVLKPAVAMEAEQFTVERGWTVVKNGHGNYMVDIIGFQHISGERLLCTDEKNATASAYRDITVPAAGAYRLWVRYEYPPFTDARFQVSVVQGGTTVAQMLMGVKDNPRAAFGDYRFRPQYDPSWGSEGLAEEVLDVKGLQAGPARIYLKAAAQSQVPGVAARRHIDLVYLTSDTADGWVKYYAASAALYPILDAFRDTMGARYEAQFTNKGTKPATYITGHVYNRIPWGAGEGVVAKDVAPGATTPWIPLTMQDTTHFGAAAFTIQGEYQPYTVAIRPKGGKVEKTYDSEKVFSSYFNGLLAYLPTYPGMGESIVTPMDEIDATLKLITAAPKVGKTPTQPLCYGMAMPLWDRSVYGKKYADLYVAIGMRATPYYGGMGQSRNDPAHLNLKERGLEINRSMAAAEYRNYPTKDFIDQWKKAMDESGNGKYLQWYDYGDEIIFSEWLSVMTSYLTRDDPAYKGQKPEEILATLWKAWLAKHRPNYRPADYWLPAWGPLEADRLHPDSSSLAAAENPVLYVDSLMFYEESAIAYVADGVKKVKATFGNDVLCGANYACHPFYYPVIPMYVKWFRGGAADMGRHSEYYWQVTQPGPMCNGFITENFRCGMRNNPKAVIKQYTMPHSPGNTEASFLRSCFTHLAHGARALDFFGIGMNETFTENYIDHSDHQRYKDIRDVTHSMGLVEDLLPQSQVVPSKVAMLLSDSTERWDFARIARDQARHDHFGSDFRQTRLSFHQERLGMWYALTFNGATPDFLIEEDLTAKVLRDYAVLYVVGDCLPVATVPALEAWVKEGGVLMATAGAGQFDPYRRPNPGLRQLLGIDARTLEERTTFMRPRQELAFLQPLATVKIGALAMPQLATWERITPAADARAMATFTDDGSPAVIARALGEGQVFYCAALPGMAYMWGGLQPPGVPDRGPGTHTPPTNFNKGALAVLELPLQAAKVEPRVTNSLGLIDTRLLKAPGGYAMPIANYNLTVGQKVTFGIRLDGTVTKVTSAYSGPLKFAMANGRLQVTVPKLGYGDMLRIDVK